MAYSGNEISFMDYTKGKRYNDYGTYNYGSAAYEIDFEKRRKEEQRIALEEEKRRKHAVRVRNERRLQYSLLPRRAYSFSAVFLQ